MKELGVMRLTNCRFLIFGIEQSWSQLDLPKVCLETVYFGFSCSDAKSTSSKEKRMNLQFMFHAARFFSKGVYDPTHYLAQTCMVLLLSPRKKRIEAVIKL